MFDCSRDASQAFQLCCIKGTSHETSAPHKIIQSVTNSAQKTRTGFHSSKENPAGEKFIVWKDIGEGLLVLSSCWPRQTLHVFTTTLPLRFQSLASRARTRLSSSAPCRDCANKGTLYLNCVWFPSWLEGAPVALVSHPAVPGVHILWSR